MTRFPSSHAIYLTLL